MKKEKIMFQIKQFCSKHEGKYHCYINNDVNEVITQRSHVMVKITHRTIILCELRYSFVKILMIIHIYIDIVGSSS